MPPFEVRGCEGCPARGRTVVTYDGNPEAGCADVLFVGVNPGAQEAIQGIPFCGPAGQLLRSVAAEILPGARLAFTNCIFCSTGNESQIPDPDACADHCRRNLLAVCRLFRPRAYVPCGAFAMRRCGIEGGVSRNSGKVFNVKGCRVIPCIHPSAVLRGFGSRAAIAAALMAVKGVLEETC